MQLQLVDGDLAHDEFLDLARDGHGERVDELPVARDLVGCDLALAEGAQVVAGQARAWAQFDPCHDLFTVLGIGHANDLNVGDLGLGV